MRYDTAVDRLHKIADACSDVSRFRVELTAAYVYGDLLAGADVEVVQVALAVDVPPEELPWRAEPTELRALAQVLRLDRAPVSWTWRPAGGPVAIHEIDGPLRFWTRDSGTDDEVLRHLARSASTGCPGSGSTPTTRDGSPVIGTMRFVIFVR